MSGDVQPRRRRDKKKKKEEQTEETTVVYPQSPPTPILTFDDVNIHVHKERSLGGGICAKCVFFLFMIVLSAIIGIIITEHRGQTDVDIPVSESRFASVFEGLTEKSIDSHDEDDDDELRIHSEEEEEEEEDEEEEGISEENDREIEESEHQSDEEEEEEQIDEDEISQEEDAESQEVQEEEADEEEEEEEEEEEQAVYYDSEAVESEEEDIAAEESEQDVEEPEVDEQEEYEEVELVEDDTPSEDSGEEKTEQDDQEGSEEAKEEEIETGNEDTDSIIEEEEEDDDPELGAANSIKSHSNVKSDIEVKSTRDKSDAQSNYEFDNITNVYDYAHKDELDQAQRHLEDNIQLALSLFTKILESLPNSPRALHGKAQALDLWADHKRSNDILQESIQFYFQVLNTKDVPDVLFIKAAERCINRMRFIGNYGRAISVHKKLIARFPNESKYQNDLAVTYLTINRIPEARSLLIDILNKWPNDGFALVHYGFILKTVDNELHKAVDYLQKGIQTKEPGVIDGRFYFHLGDALARLGNPNEAMKIYEDGVENKVFLSKYQRSLYNVDRLTARPWWKKEQTPYKKLYSQLEQHYKQIREEAMAVLNVKGYFKEESENLRDIGDWKQFELYARGMKHSENCKKCPITCKIIDSEPDVRSCRRGQVKFSVMHPGTHVWPHCGPTNCRLRIHLGLKVPPRTYIRVAEETRSWEEGKIFIFDDSFEHEVWHNGTDFRLVLIIDVWHPELTQSEKYNLSAI